MRKFLHSKWLWVPFALLVIATGIIGLAVQISSPKQVWELVIGIYTYGRWVMLGIVGVAILIAVEE